MASEVVLLHAGGGRSGCSGACSEPTLPRSDHLGLDLASSGLLRWSTFSFAADALLSAVVVQACDMYPARLRCAGGRFLAAVKTLLGGF